MYNGNFKLPEKVFKYGNTRNKSLKLKPAEKNLKVKKCKKLSFPETNLANSKKNLEFMKFSKNQSLIVLL